MDQRGEHMKMNFDYFQIQIRILHTVRAEKVDAKNGFICLGSMFPSSYSSEIVQKNAFSVILC